MDPRRLELLLRAVADSGSMREVAETCSVTTSTVSQQIAALAREAGTPLLEPDGRRVRLTPAGRRLADHAVTILAAVEAARRRPRPHGRAGRHAAGGRRSPPPSAGRCCRSRATLAEQPPAGAAAHPRARAGRGARAAGRRRRRPRADLRLQPRARPASTGPWQPARSGSTAWGLGVPTGDGPAREARRSTSFGRFRDHDWIVNSRNTADEEVVRTARVPGRLRSRGSPTAPTASTWCRT